MMKNRQQIASELSKKTGFEIAYHNGCYTLWDKNRWFSFYSIEKVLRKVQELRKIK